MNKRRRGKAKELEKERKEEATPVICLFLGHGGTDIQHSVYLIKPNLDTEPEPEPEISPMLTFTVKDRVLSLAANLGSVIYIFKGLNDLVDEIQAFNTDDPESGLKSVSNMHTSKQAPCVFVAEGFIYVLSDPSDKPATFTVEVEVEVEGEVEDCKATGCFERYDPTSDSWQVLPDPPCFFSSNGTSVATVVGHLVFIHPGLVIFDLDSFLWFYEDCLISRDARFHYRSIYTKDDTMASGFFYYPPSNKHPNNVVKIGPSPLPVADVYTLLKSPCFDPKPPFKNIVASESDLLDHTIFFSQDSFGPENFLIHMGGRFFCYVVTATLVNWAPQTINQPCSRGVWIKFFEEVYSQGQFKFRTLASFCYEICTEFDNYANWIQCFVLGSVPQSWSKDPPGNKEQKSNIFRHKANEVVQTDTNVRKEDPTENDILMKLSAAHEEIKRLEAELSRTRGFEGQRTFEKPEAMHILIGDLVSVQ